MISAIFQSKPKSDAIFENRNIEKIVFSKRILYYKIPFRYRYS